ncbi:hypothetical protein [Iningainema tapete]|uniref:Uncharacterized protein n=1 Tax=Iningainema tapete BLCC-T55 TaxID=2748662 RepID=A0A8J6XYR6_9CYAN|nr:hypothetical protein [Iningainema tapete]MBD2775573.1 hypothetical protein [Iningainema tapete BLCC-T55]
MYLPAKQPSAQQTYHWLLFLASSLKQENAKEFLIERMQPYWLQTPQQKCLYQISVGLITGLLIGLIYGLTTGWIGAGIGGVSYGLILGFTQKIYPIVSLKFSIEYAKVRLFESVLSGLWWGLVYGVIDALICGLIWGVSEGIWGMIQVVIWGLVEGLIWGVFVPEFKQTTVSNQGIRESAKNAVIFTLIGGVAWLLLYVMVLIAVDKHDEFNSLLLDGISSGLFFGIYVGGLACLQHFILRLILWWNGYIPWNYGKFLDYATEQGFLEREGGYRFKHSWLQEHFVSLCE